MTIKKTDKSDDKIQWRKNNLRTLFESLKPFEQKTMIEQQGHQLKEQQIPKDTREPLNMILMESHWQEKDPGFTEARSRRLTDERVARLT